LQASSILNPISEQLQLVDARLKEFSESSELPSLEDLLIHVFDSSGKLARPALTLLTAGFHPNDGEKVVTMATAVEMLHVATLIHDDTVDEAETRRGRVTVSSNWGQHTAVLLGDYVFAASATYVCATGNIRVIKRFSETIMDLSRGQMQETANSRDIQKGMDDYLERIYFKTASLFSTSGESGAVLSGAPESTVQILKTYSEKIGLAFQVVDDVLDITGTEQEIGKPVGSDLLNGVITLPTIYAMEDSDCRRNVEIFLADPSNSNLHSEIIEMVKASDVEERSYKYADRLIEEAKLAIKPLEDNDCKKSLLLLADFIISRNN
jgi:geranylgeranyl pyrophosphate synthase